MRQKIVRLGARSRDAARSLTILHSLIAGKHNGYCQHHGIRHIRRQQKPGAADWTQFWQHREPLSRSRRSSRDPTAAVVLRTVPARPRLRRPHNAARTNRQAMLCPSIASCPGGPRRGRVSAAETTKGTFGSAPTTNAITASRS